VWNEGGEQGAKDERKKIKTAECGDKTDIIGSGTFGQGGEE